MESALNTQFHGSLDDAYVCHTTVQQMGDKEIIEEELQKPLHEEKCERARKQVITDRDELAAKRFGSEQFTSSMTHQHNLHIEEMIIWEQRSVLEDKSDLGISVEGRPKVLHVEVTEEISRYGNTKGLQSADSVAQEELTTKFESKYFMGNFKDDLQKTSAKVEEEFRQLRSSLHKLEGGLENKLAHMHQKIDDEICLRHTRQDESREKKALIDELKTSLEKEQQMRTRVEGELRETKTVCTEMEETIHNLVKMCLTSERENYGRTLKEQESKENETIILELQKMLGEEQEARTKVEGELKQVRTAYNELKERFNALEQVCTSLKLSESYLHNLRQQELREKEALVAELQEELDNMRHAKCSMEEETQANISCIELQRQQERDRCVSTFKRIAISLVCNF